jgi:predicted phage terminase large subunit-like protein
VPAILAKTVKLSRAQAAYRRSDALYRGFVGGIGSGKSWVGAYDLIRRARRDRLYLAVAPTYTLLADATIRTFLEIARELGVVRAEDVRRQPPSVKLTTGAEILFRSADDPDRLRAMNLSGVWLDEASLMPRDVYDVLIGRLRQGGEQGWFSATFTPKGTSHWTYDVFGKPRPDTELFHARTADNPFNVGTFAATLKHQYAPQLALQELDGLFVDTEGAEFPGEWFGDHLWVSDFPEQLALRVIYLDPSLGTETRKPLRTGPSENQKSDYSAFVQLGRTGDGTLYVRGDLDRRPMPKIVADGLELARRFQPLDAFGVESNSFQRLMAEEFARVSRERGFMLPLHTVTNSTNKQVRIRRLTPHLSRGHVRFVESPGTRLLVQQLREFPLGRFDDGPDAMEGALQVAVKIWNGKRQGGCP